MTNEKDRVHVDGEPPWRPAEALLEILGLRDLLDHCLIRSSYVVPDSLVEPVVLTAAGEECLNAVRQRNRRVKPNESRLAVALNFGWADEIFVSEETDIAAWRTAISREVQAGKIMYPMVFGRELHDEIATRFPRKRRLNAVQSAKLLSGRSPGVFQSGRTVVSPFGCFESRQARSISPRLDVPGYRCPDATCNQIHSVHLTTGESAISKARGLVSRYLQDADRTGFAERPNQVSRAFAAYLDVYGPKDSAALIELLADSLEIDELRAVCDLALREHFKIAEQKSSFLRRFSVAIQDPSHFCRSLELERCMALLLFFTDDELSDAVSAAVDNGEIHVDDISVRVPRIRRTPRRPGVRVELGRYGIRFRSARGSSYGAERMAELVHEICRSDGDYTSEDLAYAIGLPENTPINEIEDKVFADFSVERLVDEVVLPSRSAVRAACKHLGLTKYLRAERSELRKRILWRMGVDTPTAYGEIETTGELLRDLRQSIASASSESELRGCFANLFVALETTLMTALEFTTWALTIDHYVAEDGFSFSRESSKSSIDFLDPHGYADDNSLWSRGEMPSLAAIASGFGRLSRKFRELDPNSHLRPMDQLPQHCIHQQRPFAFKSRLPFLNLDEKVREEIVDCLSEISRLGRHPAVTGVRNAGLHGNNEFPSHEDIQTCIEKVDSLLEIFSSTGLHPLVFRRSLSTRDELGRGRVTYQNGKRTIEFPTTSWVVAPRLPNGADSLLLMPVAKNSGWGPLRFGLLQHRGPEDYWRDWPTQWERDAGYATEPEITVEPQADTMVG